MLQEDWVISTVIFIGIFSQCKTTFKSLFKIIFVPSLRNSTVSN